MDAWLAIPCALLPKRYWPSFDLPVASVAPLSSWLTMVGGFVIGIPAYFAFLDRLRGVTGLSIYDISTAQLEGRLPDTAQVSAIPSVVYMTAPLQFLFTPLGAVAVYMVLTGLFRIVASLVDDAQGDPVLTGLDALGGRLLTRQQQRAARVERQQLERMDEPDRRYDGGWADLAGVDFVIVAARRKAGWTRGTWVITEEDGWFVLGEPFDRPMANGLRTIYPLTAQTTLEPVRKSVQYRLPPLRQTPPRRLQDETPRRPGES
jgi:hypothetical protein